jgi:hypothetical protein
MWRGYNKFKTEEAFEALATFPSKDPLPSTSAAGLIEGIEGGKYAQVFDDLIPSSLTEDIREQASRVGYEAALLNTGSDKQEQGELNELVRKGKRAIIHSQELAGLLWERLESHIPPQETVPGPRYNNQWRAVGVNPTLRVLRYDQGDHFEVHQDGSYSYECTTPSSGGQDSLRSFLTLQVYLSQGGGRDFLGGATRMFKRIPCSTQEDVEDIVASDGRVLLFAHNIWHTGERVAEGQKLVLRSEIMYSKKSTRD